jgi:ectoine hydroxylase-related dioxygenase (phytanoyl-CoA dioxygenase family)
MDAAAETDMDWIVNIPAGESAGAELSTATASAARGAFHEHGCVLLRGALAPAAVEAMHRDYAAQFGGMDYAATEAEAAKPAPNRFLRVGGARYDIVVRMTGAFGDPAVFANARLLGLIEPVLGGDLHLSNFSVVVSHPGATMQHPHRDNEHLFAEPGVGPALPVYAINVAVPLIDVDTRTGPTGVWLGSHRLPPNPPVQRESMTVPSLQRGDCMLLDYRTMHAGLPNASARARPILYMVYARPWFFDHANHVRRIPLDMPLDHYNRLPDSLRRLLVRAHSEAARMRWHEADAPGRATHRPAADPPGRAPLRPAADRPQPSPLPAAAKGREAGKVGRNDLCPCGSGRKYKHCHGQIAVG